MKKILLFELNSGISGDMFCAALLDLNDNFEFLLNELKKLSVENYSAELVESSVNGIRCKKFNVKYEQKHHHHTSFKDIKKIINSSKFSEKIKNQIIEIFTLIAEAESKIHNKKLDEVSFHEVGAVDSIIDIVSAVLLMEKYNDYKIVVTSLAFGSGTATCQHGKIPIPVPATVEILKGVPVKFTDIPCELVTPTGAALIKYYAEEYSMKTNNTEMKKIGYGCGSRKIEQTANIARVFEMEIKNESEYEQIYFIETNIDDTSPELISRMFDDILELGVNDIYSQSVNMKKNRTGIKLSVLCYEDKIEEVINYILNSGITIGLRFSQMFRKILPRQIKKIKTSFGMIACKESVLPNGNKIVKPEYDDIEKISIEKNIPIKILYNKILKEL